MNTEGPTGGSAIQVVVRRSLDGERLTNDEIAALFGVPLFSPDWATVQWAGREKSVRASAGLAEVHAQVGLNIAPCPRNCGFCSFAARNQVFTETTELPVEEAVARARQFERQGANAVYLMATANYSFGKFLEVGAEVRSQLNRGTVMVANVGDFDGRQAGQLRRAGFAGVYHALRLGEGLDTLIPPEKRLETFRHTAEAGLWLGTCVEPVGPEHCLGELVAKAAVARDAAPVFSGAARRIPIPGTDLARHGLVSEARMAHWLAVVRLAMGYEVAGNCTHEPNVVGASAGANLLWAEAGANPRDIEARTETRRGASIEDCRKVLLEAEWRVLAGPSRFFAPGLWRSASGEEE